MNGCKNNCKFYKQEKYTGAMYCANEYLKIHIDWPEKNCSFYEPKPTIKKRK